MTVRAASPIHPFEIGKGEEERPGENDRNGADQGEDATAEEVLEVAGRSACRPWGVGLGAATGRGRVEPARAGRGDTVRGVSCEPRLCSSSTRRCQISSWPSSSCWILYSVVICSSFVLSDQWLLT